VDDEKNNQIEDTLEAQYNAVKKRVWSASRPIDAALEIAHALLIENRRQQTVMRAAYVELEESHRSPRAVSLKRALLGEDPNTIYPNMMSAQAREEFLVEVRDRVGNPQAEPEYTQGPSPMLGKVAFEQRRKDSEKT